MLMIRAELITVNVSDSAHAQWSLSDPEIVPLHSQGKTVL